MGNTLAGAVGAHDDNIHDDTASFIDEVEKAYAEANDDKRTLATQVERAYRESGAKLPSYLTNQDVLPQEEFLKLRSKESLALDQARLLAEQTALSQEERRLRDEIDALRQNADLLSDCGSAPTVRSDGFVVRRKVLSKSIDSSRNPDGRPWNDLLGSSVRASALLERDLRQHDLAPSDVGDSPGAAAANLRGKTPDVGGVSSGSLAASNPNKKRAAVATTESVLDLLDDENWTDDEDDDDEEKNAGNFIATAAGAGSAANAAKAGKTEIISCAETSRRRPKVLDHPLACAAHFLVGGFQMMGGGPRPPRRSRGNPAIMAERATEKAAAAIAAQAPQSLAEVLSEVATDYVLTDEDYERASQVLADFDIEDNDDGKESSEMDGEDTEEEELDGMTEVELTM